MKTYLLIFIFFFSGIKFGLSQSANELQLFTLEYKGNPDIYSFVYDENTGSYCYIYRIEDENKVFIISNNSLSVKYDFIHSTDIVFDKKGNYFAVSGNYKQDYGLDNNFLIINGEEKFNADYIESYSSFLDDNGEFNFIFKEDEKFYFGKINSSGKLTKSDSFDFIKTMYNDSVNLLSEGDSEESSAKKYFYMDEKGRGFIAFKNGLASLIIGGEIIQTRFTDINEASVTRDKNGSIAFIAKSNGRIFESPGGEFVSAGNTVYDTFFMVYPPIYFNDANVPVYYASDSTDEYRYEYYAVIGNQKQEAMYKGNPVSFSNYIYDIKLSGNEITYIGIDEVVIPAADKSSEQVTYDEYYSLYYYVKNNSAHEMGYNLSEIKYNKDGRMLFSGIADLSKKEYILMESNGESRVIVNKEGFDAVYYFGYAPTGEIYYAGEIYEDSVLNKKRETQLIIGNSLIGSFDYVLFQGVNNEYSVLKYNSANDYAFAAVNKSDEIYSASVYLNGKKMPAPEFKPVAKSNLESIFGLSYTSNDKLFYIGEYKEIDSSAVYQCYLNNLPVGQYYDFIGSINYNDRDNTYTFFASRGKSIYKVIISC